MEEQNDSTQGSGKKLTSVIIFLSALLIVGTLVSFVGKGKKDQSLQTGLSSDTITDESPEPTALGTSTKDMEKVTELKIEDQVVGTGDVASAGKRVTVNYTGTLTDGIIFDSNVKSEFGHVEPFVFSLGAGEVIQGWDQGVAGMKVGGKRILTIPSDLAYGDSGVPGAIPGGATLVFEVELLKVE